MAEAKHTSGPWVASGEINARYLNGIGDVLLIRCGVVGDDRYVAAVTFDAMSDGSIRTSPEERASNARLIAAAPDLLAVVREACAIFDANREGDEFNGDLVGDLWKNEIHEKLTAAIAKTVA